MPVETAPHLADLNAANPPATDGVLQGDDHLRLIKTALRATFVNFTSAALTATQAQIDSAITQLLTGPYLAPVGSAAAPQLSWTGDANSGRYWVGADEYGESLGGVVRVKLGTYGIDIVSGTLKLAGTNAFPVATANIGDLQVTTGKLADLAVEAGKIAALAVTLPKISVSATARLLGRYSASAGAAEEVSLAGNLSLSAAGVLTGGASRGHLGGMGLSNGTDANNDIDIGEGVCRSSDNTFDITVSAITKQLDATFTTGTAAGGLDTGARANSTTYHVHGIGNPTTGASDVCFSLNATTPAVTGYTKFRRIGSVMTDGSGNIRAFSQDGDEFLYPAWFRDVNASTPQSTAVLATLTVPTGIKLRALISANAAASSGVSAIIFSSPDVTDQTPSGATRLTHMQIGSGVPASFHGVIRTDTSGRVRYRGDTTGGVLDIYTQGFFDRRGQH